MLQNCTRLGLLRIKLARLRVGVHFIFNNNVVYCIILSPLFRKQETEGRRRDYPGEISVDAHEKNS